MSVNGRVAALVGVASVLTLSLLAAQAPPPPAESFAASGKEWSLFGGDWGNRRHSTLTQITPANVRSLRGAWVSEPFLEGAVSRSAPVVKDGLMYVSAPPRVYALDARTGRHVWSYKPGDASLSGEGLTRTVAARAGAVVPNTQGVSVGQGLVFVGLMQGDVVALRAKTGEAVWRKSIGDSPAPRGQLVSQAVTYANGVVFAGTSNGDYGLRPRVVALDAATGRELWRFYSVPGPGEPGHETWSANNDVWMRGGGGFWRTGAVDPDLGLIYFNVGNPWPQFGGEIRVGDNLYTSSVVALDMKTGKLRWHRQLARHDIWDMDLATPVVLFNVGARKAIGAMRPDGYLFVFDRETGEPVIPVEQRPVPQDKAMKTAPTQPFPVGGESILPDPSYWKDKIPKGFVLSGSQFQPPVVEPPNIIAPSPNVRSHWMTYSPQTGYVYSYGNAALRRARRTPDPYVFSLGGTDVPGWPESFGVLAAIDGRTGKVAWSKRTDVGTLGGGGLMTTASGLLFNVAAAEGHLEAYDAKTGDRLARWMIARGGQSSGGLTSSYEIDGNQYIAATWGSVVRAFALGGPVELTPAPPEAARPASSAQAADPFTGPIQASLVIEMASLVTDVGLGGGTRWFVDEYSVKPYRTGVATGNRVIFGNNGYVTHTIVAMDGSWTTGSMKPGQTVTRVFEKAGRYGYTCKEHPWTYGQVVVEEPGALRRTTGTGGSQAPPREDQAARGERQFGAACASCHGTNLGGGSAPPLAGLAFAPRWADSTVGDLYNKVRTTMPQDSPGSLGDQANLDIVAFIMRANEFAPRGELTPGAQALGVKLGK